jgi:hypothetical protein
LNLFIFCYKKKIECIEEGEKKEKKRKEKPYFTFEFSLLLQSLSSKFKKFQSNESNFQFFAITLIPFGFVVKSNGQKIK